MSNRQAVGEVQPLTTTALQLPAIVLSTASTKTNSTGTTVAWTQPGFPQSGSTFNAVDMIWAINTQGPTSSAQNAVLYKHQTRGFITLDLTKPYQGGAVTSSETSSSSSASGGAQRGMTKRNMIVWAHMIIGIVAWLLILPTGVFIGRFGRTKFRWFPAHRAVQTVGILFVIIAMFLGFGTIWCLGAASQGRQLTLTHHKLGLALALLAVFQGLLGQFGHIMWHRKAIRLQNFLHIIIGIVIIPLATWNMGEGFELWEYNPPRYAAYIVSTHTERETDPPKQKVDPCISSHSCTHGLASSASSTSLASPSSCPRSSRPTSAAKRSAPVSRASARTISPSTRSTTAPSEGRAAAAAARLLPSHFNLLLHVSGSGFISFYGSQIEGLIINVSN